MKDKKSAKKRDYTRSYLWRIIRQAAGRCAMASWGLPFEAIAAWILTDDEKQSPSRQGTKKDL